MTRNKFYLTEFEDYDGGFISFGDGKGRISGKAPEGEGSAIPLEPQPTPSISHPHVLEPQTTPLQTKTPPTVSHEPQTEAHIEQILPSPSTYHRKHRKTQKHRRAKKVIELPQTSMPLNLGTDKAIQKEGGMDIGGSTRCQETIEGTHAQTRSKRVLEKPNKPPLPEGHTSGSEEGSMEHTFELMDTIPPLIMELSSKINGVAERRNRTLIEATRTMLVDSKLPTTFWAEAVNTACYVLRIVKKKSGMKPTEVVESGSFKKRWGDLIITINAAEASNAFRGTSGKRDNIVAGQAKKKIEPEQKYILIPIFTTDPLISQDPKVSEEDAKEKPTEMDES
ncbi:uncharacterized mitochondrial protein-like protein [Tanacetum coccineum]